MLHAALYQCLFLSLQLHSTITLLQTQLEKVIVSSERIEVICRIVKVSIIINLFPGQKLTFLLSISLAFFRTFSMVHLLLMLLALTHNTCGQLWHEVNEFIYFTYSFDKDIFCFGTIELKWFLGKYDYIMAVLNVFFLMNLIWPNLTWPI